MFSMLLDFVVYLCEVSGLLVGIKMVVGFWVVLEEMFEVFVVCLDDVFDFIMIDGGEGGMGVVLMLFMDLVGMLVWEVLFMLVDLCKFYGF